MIARKNEFELIGNTVGLATAKQAPDEEMFRMVQSTAPPFPNKMLPPLSTRRRVDLRGFCMGNGTSAVRSG